MPYSWTVVSTKKAPSRDKGEILMLNTLLFHLDHYSKKVKLAKELLP